MKLRRSLRVPRRALSGLVGLCALVLALTGVLPAAPSATAAPPPASGPAQVTRQAGPDAPGHDDSVPAWVWAVVGASGGGALTFALGYKLWLNRRTRERSRPSEARSDPAVD